MRRVACPRCRQRFELGAGTLTQCPACGLALKLNTRKLEKHRFLGRYRLDAKIASGQQGDVFRGVDRERDRPVAVKVLNPAVARAGIDAARFHREAQLAARIEHPNVVRILDSGEENGMVYLVMEVVEGKDLAAYVKARGPFSIATALSAAIQAGWGLAAAHAAGVLHRDIKPGNLIFDGSAKKIVLTDFGLAKSDQTNEFLTRPGMILGTPSTMAPEFANGEPASEASDQYALGVTLYFLVAGRYPYRAPSDMEILLQHLHEPIPDLREARPDCPAGVAEAVAMAMAKDPERRFPSVRAFVDRLVEVKDHPERPAAKKKTLARSRRLGRRR